MIDRERAAVSGLSPVSEWLFAVVFWSAALAILALALGLLPLPIGKLPAPRWLMTRSTPALSSICQRLSTGPAVTIFAPTVR